VPVMRSHRLALALAAGALGGAPAVAAADPSSGVDAALFRPSYDSSGVFSLEGARLPTKRDLTWKMLLGFASSPLDLHVPGISSGSETSSVLNYTLTLDMAFGFSVTKRFGIGLAAAVYRTDTGVGYGERGRYRGLSADPSTGMISLRDVSNIDPSGGFEPQGLSGPLDVRVGGKYQLIDGPKLAVTAIGTVALPFGEDEMFLGDANLMFEPRLAIDYRKDRLHATKLVVNAGARIRQRTVLEAYDPRMLETNQTPEDAARAVLDVGSEAFVGVGGLYELSPSFIAAAELVGFVPLPGAASYGACRLANGRRCDALDAEDFAPGAKQHDFAAYGVAGIHYRMSPHLTASVAGSASPIGARGDDFRVMVGATWSPQPDSEARIGRGDKDGDGVPDLSDGCPEDAEDRDGYQDDDGCPDLDNDGDGVLDVDDGCRDEPEDRDSFQDDDGCPERDNDADTIPDVADRCPDEAEDVDGFEDDDGCPDEDNDGDGFADKSDRCPNDPETVNGVDDDVGCPDVRASTGPVEAGDRIDLRGNKIEFVGGANLTPASKVILGQVATLIRDKGLAIRIEVHVPLGTRSRAAAEIRRQKARDKALAQRRAEAIFAYLRSQGVPESQMPGAVGLGSDRPLGNNPPTDALNERVDFIKAQQRSP